MQEEERTELPQEILERLKYFRQSQDLKNRRETLTILEYGQDSVSIDETKNTGEAHLVIQHCCPVISFSALELNHWSYLNYENVSDGLILEFTGEKWKAHIFELKKKVSNSHWSKTKKQFAGTYLYLQMIKGLLGITIDQEDIFYYIGYRIDEIQEQKKATPIELHRGLLGFSQNDKTGGQSIAGTEWKTQQTCLKLYEDIKCSFQKIQLDEATGEGQYRLS